MQAQKDKFNKIVIWGLKNRYHTHRHIHQAFYRTAKKLGYKCVWLEDSEKSARSIEKNDIIISIDASGKLIKEKLSIKDYNMPIRDDVFYCLHNFKTFFTDKIKPQNLLKLQIYTDKAKLAEEKWGPLTYFDPKSQTLFQPWGTNLLPEEFKEPVFNRNKTVFWIGSIWNDIYDQGNINEVSELKAILKKHGIRFINVRFVPDFVNAFLIRIS
ncbi:MAG: hypothetical protein WCX27_02790, partial [Candidatus Paceibacterota bacterium]